MPKYHVQRSIEIDASPQKVFDTIADYGTWTTWSPWLCLEPDADVSVSADSSRVGSNYRWRGELVGEGEIEHLNLVRSELIEDEIRFIKPFRSTSQVSFDVQPVADRTRVTWHMRGSLPWFLFWMTKQIEVFIALDYDRGLKMLKQWVETGRVLSKTTIEGIEPVGPLRVLGVRTTGPMAEIGPLVEQSFRRAAELLGDGVCQYTPMSVYHKFDMKQQVLDFTAGFAVPDSGEPVPAGLQPWSIPSKQALRVSHVGSYENLGNAWSAGNQYARYKKIKLSSDAGYETYLNDPHTTDPAELRTDIFLLLK